MKIRLPSDGTIYEAKIRFCTETGMPDISCRVGFKNPQHPKEMFFTNIDFKIDSKITHTLKELLGVRCIELLD